MLTFPRFSHAELLDCQHGKLSVRSSVSKCIPFKALHHSHQSRAFVTNPLPSTMHFKTTTTDFKSAAGSNVSDIIPNP